jgi:hypothetical protein
MIESLKRAGGYGTAPSQAATDGPFRTVVFQPREDKWRAVRDRAEAIYFRAIIETASSEREAIEMSGMKKAQFYVILKRHGLSFNG